MKDVKERVERFRANHRRRGDLLFIAVLVLAAGIFFAGVYFLYYVRSLIGALERVSYALSQLQSPPSTTPREQSAGQIAEVVGQNTMWIPIFVGLLVALLAVTYLLRIHVNRSKQLEDELIKLDKWDALLASEGIPSTALEQAILAESSASQDDGNHPSRYPTLEIANTSMQAVANLANKSVDAINSLQSKS